MFMLYQHAQPDPIEIQRQQENRRRAIARKRAKEQLRPRSPDPVEGRKHIVGLISLPKCKSIEEEGCRFFHSFLPYNLQ